MSGMIGLCNAIIYIFAVQQYVKLKKKTKDLQKCCLSITFVSDMMKRKGAIQLD